MSCKTPSDSAPSAPTANVEGAPMANIQPQPPVLLNEDAQHMHIPAEHGENMSSAHSDSAEDDETLDIDQDDAQSMIQPALSAAATRLTSQRTPAAEKAAAMESIPGGGLFNVIDCSPPREPGRLAPPASGRTGNAPSPSKYPAKTPSRHARGLSLGNLPSSSSQAGRYQPPSPWQTGPKELVIPNEPSHKSTLSGIFDYQARIRRSSSSGTEALKRIREALPSISLPSFFSNPTWNKSQGLDMKASTGAGNNPSEQKQTWTAQAPLTESPAVIDKGTPSANQSSFFSLTDPPNEVHPPRQSGPFPVRPRAPRRSTSDDSMLYHSLSRVSSLGDDDRWANIREQKNSRLKAITDSWDRPTFKLPQLPKPLKRHTPFLSESNLGDTAYPTIPEADGSARDPLSDLDQALETMTGDVVILGGYRGSILRSTKTNRQVWVPVKLGLNIRKANLEVGLDPEDEERMEETIYPSGMLKNIGPVDISKRLFKRIRESENARAGKLRVWDYGYDWRLSPHLLSRKLNEFIAQLPSNQSTGSPEERGALVIAHSLGGLITRHAVNQRPELYSGVIFAGTPQRCINILGPIRNGDAVLFNEKVLTAQVNFSLRTSFVFLPEDGYCFINKHTGEEFPVDFYDPAQWAKHSLSPCIEPALPAFNARGALGSLREFSGRIPTPLRSRGNSSASDTRPPGQPSPTTQNPLAEAVRRVEIATDRTLAPQMGAHTGSGSTAATTAATAQQQQSQQQSSSSPFSTSFSSSTFNPLSSSSNSNNNSNSTSLDAAARRRNTAYLARTLADTRRFRAEAAHRPEHSRANAYPPLAIIYGKDVPTVSAAHVSSREAIACADAYDNLVFQSGDGVVLAREAQLPPGYDVVRGGRVSTDRGHITMLGDLEAVGRALRAVVRGRRKGIGLGRSGGAQRRVGAGAGGEKGRDRGDTLTPASGESFPSFSLSSPSLASPTQF
ncbi:hypothetical protein SLS62_006279 [Diatrype stigma]|uniref:Uncharacterized protein n=1 Tax=Diatrype stigma TaxID=117547 RepID=A0AAN9V1F5_9PEZI